ncbi:hypothetical protein Salpa_4084 [Sporomusa sp. KB1]|nr:hypothetical protein Salpa_4084 [Sporomusa sp. KB1]
MHNTTRSKALFWIIFLLITCFMLSLLLDIGTNIHTAIKLKKYGVETIATISEYEPQNGRVSKFWQKYTQTETRHIHAITYDGFTNNIELDHQYSLTSRIPVIYDKDDPSVVWINTIPRSTWKLIFTNMKIIGFTKGDILNILFYTGLGVVAFFILIKAYFKDDSL